MTWKTIALIAGARRVAPLPVPPFIPESAAPRRLRNFVEELMEDPVRGGRHQCLAIYADETYLQAVHRAIEHILIEDQVAPDRGNDIVRSGAGHITVTPVEHQVNPAGHIDTSKTGAIASHGNPDEDGSEQVFGWTSVTNVAQDDTAKTADGTLGLEFTGLTRIAYAIEYGILNLYAYFRTRVDDRKGHGVRIASEAKSAPIPILSPDGVNLTLSTGTLTHIVGPHVYGHETYQTSLHGISLDARGHVRKVYAYGGWTGPTA